MAMATKTDWLSEGLRVLAADGVTALTIDRLAGALTLSKGSFYHHFPGMPAFRTALLDHYEARFTTRYIGEIDALGNMPTVARLRHLLDLVLAKYDAENPEPAFRAWATRDPEARATMERVDATRVGYLRDLWQAATGDAVEAETVGTMLYVVLVGAEHVQPRIPSARLRTVYDLLLQRLSAPSRQQPRPEACSGGLG